MDGAADEEEAAAEAVIVAVGVWVFCGGSEASNDGHSGSQVVRLSPGYVFIIPLSILYMPAKYYSYPL